VLSHGNDAGSSDLIDRLRSSAAEREPEQEKTPGIGSQGSGAGTVNAAPGAEGSNVGLTQLLRSMGLESQPTQAAAKPAAGVTPRGAGSDESITAMLASLQPPAGQGPAAVERSGVGNPPPAPAQEPRPGAVQNQDQLGFTQQFSGAVGGSRTFRAVPDQSAAAAPIAPVLAPRKDPPAAPANQPGEFTRLFNSLGGEVQESPAPQVSRNVPSSTPAAGPGAFTQLFNSLGSEGSATSVPQASQEMPSASPGTEQGAFTRMFSAAPAASPARSEFHEDFKPLPETGRFDLGQFAPVQTPPMHEPVARMGTEEVPFEPASQSGPKESVTQLLRRLDSPVSKPEPIPEPRPSAPVSRGGSGGLTEIFASLDQPMDSGFKTGTPAQGMPQSGSGPAPWEQPSSATNMNQRTVPAAPAPPVSSGPSEFTRILDASRIREMGLRGGQSAGAPASSTVPVQPPAAPAMPAAPQMPSYPMPAAPQMGGMPAGAHPGSIPGSHPGSIPGAYPPQAPQMSGYAMNAGAHAGGMPGGAGMAQIPGAHVPAVAAPAVPQAPAVAPPAGGMGKMQKYVPLLLMLIIFLLVGLLVTVVFLMKK